MVNDIAMIRFFSFFCFLFFVSILGLCQTVSSEADSIVYEYDTIHTLSTVNLFDNPIPDKILYGNLGFVWQVQNMNTSGFSAFSNAIGSSASIAVGYESHVFETGISLLQNNQIFSSDISSLQITKTQTQSIDSSLVHSTITVIDTVARYREILPDTMVYHYVTTSKERIVERMTYRTVTNTKIDSLITKKKVDLCNQYRIIEIPLKYGFRLRHKYLEANFKLGSLFRWVIFSSSQNVNPFKDYEPESMSSITIFYLGACADISLQYLLTERLFAHSSLKYTIFPSVQFFDKPMTIQTIGVQFGLSYILKK